jgi:hypothetical protein
MAARLGQSDPKRVLRAGVEDRPVARRNVTTVATTVIAQSSRQLPIETWEASL